MATDEGKNAKTNLSVRNIACLVMTFRHVYVNDPQGFIPDLTVKGRKHHV